MGTYDPTEYTTTFEGDFFQQRAVSQAKRTTSKQELQKSHIVFGDPSKRYFEVSTK